MKPFNLEEALAGKPVVTRDGKKVYDIFHLSSMRNERNVLAIFEYDCMLYRHDGTCIFNSKEPHSSDLLMESEKKSIWVNVYEDRNGKLWVNGDYNTRDIAGIVAYNSQGITYKHIKTIEITNEP